jgi:hypothetical protein
MAVVCSKDTGKVFIKNVNLFEFISDENLGLFLSKIGARGLQDLDFPPTYL